MSKLNKKQSEAKITQLNQLLDKSDGYFRCICEALNIDHQSKLTEILVAIEAKDKLITELRLEIKEIKLAARSLLGVEPTDYPLPNKLEGELLTKEVSDEGKIR